MVEGIQGRNENQLDNDYFNLLVFQIRPSSRAFCHLKIRTTALDKNFTEVPEIASQCISVILLLPLPIHPTHTYQNSLP